MTEYTVTDVAARFQEAARTLRRLPPVALNKHLSTWPPVIRTVMENLQAEPEPMRFGPPSAQAISRMDEVMGWIFYLESEDERRLVWLRAERVPWKKICWKIGCCRTTAYHMWRVAILKITFRLNMEDKNV